MKRFTSLTMGSLVSVAALLACNDATSDKDQAALEEDSNAEGDQGAGTGSVAADGSTNDGSANDDGATNDGATNDSGDGASSPSGDSATAGSDDSGGSTAQNDAESGTGEDQSSESDSNGGASAGDDEPSGDVDPGSEDPVDGAPVEEGDTGGEDGQLASLTNAECVAAGGTVVGDPGDGSVHRPDYVCADSGEPPIASIQPGDGEPIAIEGAVCCGGKAESGGGGDDLPDPAGIADHALGQFAPSNA